MNKNFFAILAILSFSNIAHALLRPNISENINQFSNEFISISRWGDKYKTEREKDAKTILNSIEGELVQDLNEVQKKKVINWMQILLITQMLKDQQFFCDKMIKYLNNYFTVDEMKMLNRYFKTNLMQSTIQASIDDSLLTASNVENINSKKEEQELIDDFAKSYLSKRFTRFQETINSEMSEAIYLRTRQTLEAIMKMVPLLINYVKDDQNVIDKNLHLPALSDQ